MQKRDKLHWIVQQVIEGGGEGVILQQKASLYERGRSLSLIKMKVCEWEEREEGEREGEGERKMRGFRSCLSK